MPDQPISDRPQAHVPDAGVTDAQVMEPVEEPAVAERTLALPTLPGPTVEEPTEHAPTPDGPTVASPIPANPTVAEPTGGEPVPAGATSTAPEAESSVLEDSLTTTTPDAEVFVLEDPLEDPLEDSHEADPLRREIAAAYAPVVALYRLCENRLRETGPAGPGSPIGWAPHLRALRALRDGDVTGRWEDLGRLMVDPASLAPGTDQREADRLGAARAATDTAHALLIQAPAGPERTEVVCEIVRRLADGGERVLLVTPSTDAVDALADSVGILTVRAEPLEDPAPGTGPREGRSHGVTIRTAGTAHRRRVKDELRGLRRDLMWLEQWPRDRDAVTIAQAEQERCRRALAADEERLSAQVGERHAAVAVAEQAATTALKTRDRLAGEYRQAAEDAAGSRARRDELQQAADTAARVAAECGRAAEAARSRCSTLEERLLACRQELQAARDREASLTGELTRAREALPQATAEVERLSSAAADAAAEGHMSYYRMTAAESALTAERKTLSWGQRMRPSPELQELRRQVSAYRRETDDAGAQAMRARQALERAEAHRDGLAAFVSDGTQELIQVKAAQERLGTEIEQVSAERDAARSELPEHIRRAAEAGEQATRAATAAGQAQELNRQAEERLAGLRFAHEQASMTADRIQADRQATLLLLTEAEAALESFHSRMEADLAQGLAEITMVLDAEAASRRHVLDMCGGDAAPAEEALARHRDQAMARIEELSAAAELLAQEPLVPGDGGAPDALAQPLLAAAGLICATPLGLAAGPLAQLTDVDTLIVDQADQITDGEFLIGAVRARRWILLGDETGRPPRAYQEYEDHVHALAALHLAERSAKAEADLDEPDLNEPDLNEPDLNEPDLNEPDLDEAITAVAKRWGEHEPLRLERLPEVRSEAGRLVDHGLWEDRYRDCYAQALRRSRPTGGADPEQALVTALTDRLERSVFERCSTAAPDLCLKLVPDQGEPAKDSLP